MRKVLSLLLSVVMVLSVAVVGISAADAVLLTTTAAAPEGTPIDSLAALTTLTADGKYYLTADLTIPAMTLEIPFTGTIDGNGHTITVSAPVFAEFEGTVKNLTIKGSIDASGAPGHAGAIAKTVNGDAVFENVKNTAAIKGYLTDADGTYRSAAGGLVGCILKGVVTFTNCSNTADITGHAVGGIVGSYDDADANYDKAAYCVTFTGCSNSGHISASDSTKTTNAGAAGGILGIANKINYVYFTDCKNTGKVEADKACGGPAGGICGYIYTGLKENKGEAIFKGCVNDGEIISADSQCGGICGWSRMYTEAYDLVNNGYVHSGINADGVANGYCGGVFCRVAADKGATDTIIKNCLNTGRVESGRDQAGGIVAYHNGGNVTIDNCTNKGAITYSATPKNNVQIGGIMANSAQSGIDSVITLNKCTNYGELTPNNNNVGGIIDYVYGTSKQYAVVNDCVNYGTINAKTFGGQIVGYTNTVATTVNNCIGLGKIVVAAEDPALCFPVVIGCSSAKAAEYKLNNVMLVEGDGTKYYSYTKTEANADSIIELANAPAGFVSVVSAAEAEAAAKKIDKLGYQAPAAPVTPDDPGTPVKPVQTADTAVYFVVIAVVSVLGCAVVSRKVRG